jgi:biopolymer transport protein ExbD
MAGAASQFEDDDSGRMITEINVTPLVDITLVLLIIFMVTTTYIVNPSIKVDLPKAMSGSDQTRTTLALTLTKDGQLYLNRSRPSCPRIRICRPSSPLTRWCPTAVWCTSSIS